MPLPHRHDYAAGIHRGLLTGDINRPKEFPDNDRRVRTAARPTSAKLELVDSIERLSNAGFSRTPSELACRTRTVWQYRPVPSLSGLLSTLTGVSGDQAAPSLRPPAATDRPRRCLTSTRSCSASWRSMSATHSTFGPSG